ncbi:MAG TPA: hypothetical protein VHZ74_19440 [Bryobacteraceae bacterium]|nr:hypothetical protein [Bryobacteraceae bacterium]
MPSAHSVVHHGLYFADPNGKAHERPRQGSEPGFNGTRPGGEAEPPGAWAVGAQPHFQPEGLALPVKKGSDFAIRDSYTLPAAFDAVSIGAHAHYIGKQLTMTATLPTGEGKTRLPIKDWDFSWQDLPKDRRLDAEVHSRMVADPAPRRKVAGLLAQ